MYHKNTLLPPSVNVPPLGDYQSLPELFIDKANHFAKLGKDYFQIDAVSRDKCHFNKFEFETKRIASAFYKLGLRKGDMVIFMPTEMIKLHVAMTGIWRANGFCRASYPEDDSETLRNRIEEGHCKFLLGDHGGLETCREAVKVIPWRVHIILMETHPEFASIHTFLDEDDRSDCPQLDVALDDTALILCTSGTTGPSKGAVYTHAQLMYNIHMRSIYPFTESKPNMIFSKGTHASGSLFTFAFLISGKTCIVTGKITNEIILKTVDELRPGFAFAFPTFLLVLVSQEASGYDMSSLETLWTGGTVITPAIRDALFRLPNLKDFINGYGLTESITATTSALLPADESKEEKSIRELPDLSVGRVYPDTYVQIRDVDTFEVLGPNQFGEICCKNPGIFKGYYKNPEATKNAFIDGFVRTGDLGFYDENFHVFIKDRIKDILKYFNNHISPSELEAVIGNHPNVGDVCVVGVSDPAGGGDIPRAFVTVKRSISSCRAEEIRKFADDQLPDYKHLRGGVHIVSEIPKGKTGKVARNLVSKLPV